MERNIVIEMAKTPELNEKAAKRLWIILLSMAFLLCIPLIAMQFSNDVNWSLFDFVVAGVLLLLAGLSLELVLRKIKIVKYRIVAICFLFLVFFLIWAELSVGIFGTPFAGS